MDFTASFRWWKRTMCTDVGGHFLVSVHTFWGLSSFFFFFFCPHPPSDNTHLYLLNGLCQYKWTHPEPFNLPILILTVSSCHENVEVLSQVLPK